MSEINRTELFVFANPFSLSIRIKNFCSAFWEEENSSGRMPASRSSKCDFFFPRIIEQHRDIVHFSFCTQAIQHILHRFLQPSFCDGKMFRKNHRVNITGCVVHSAAQIFLQIGGSCSPMAQNDDYFGRFNFSFLQEKNSEMMKP